MQKAPWWVQYVVMIVIALLGFNYARGQGDQRLKDVEEKTEICDQRFKDVDGRISKLVENQTRTNAETAKLITEIEKTLVAIQTETKFIREARRNNRGLLTD